MQVLIFAHEFLTYEIAKCDDKQEPGRGIIEMTEKEFDEYRKVENAYRSWQHELTRRYFETY
jgi:hypothetical protein